MNKELLQQALDALKLHGKQYPHMQKGYCIDAIKDLRAAIAQRDELVAKYVAQPAPVAQTNHGIEHSLEGFCGDFESEYGRKPTEQEIWNHVIRSWRDLNLVAAPVAQAEPQIDTARLDWLEQQHWDSDELFELVNNWTTQDNKRHGGGLRDAIDAAMNGSDA